MRGFAAEVCSTLAEEFARHGFVPCDPSKLQYFVPSQTRGPARGWAAIGRAFERDRVRHSIIVSVGVRDEDLEVLNNRLTGRDLPRCSSSVGRSLSSHVPDPTAASWPFDPSFSTATIESLCHEIVECTVEYGTPFIRSMLCAI